LLVKHTVPANFFPVLPALTTFVREREISGYRRICTFTLLTPPLGFSTSPRYLGIT